jgi:hypothetical protein
MERFLLILIVIGAAAGVIFAIIIPVARDLGAGNSSTSTSPGVFSFFKNILNVEKGTSTKVKGYIPPGVPNKNTNTSYPANPTPAPVTPPAPTPPPGFTVNQLSPAYQSVRISSVYMTYSQNTPSSFQLSGGYSQKESVNITGWQLKGNRWGLIIPKALKDFDVYGGSLEEDIHLVSGGRVYGYSFKSPIGKSFQLNLCSGYLNSIYTFNPTLPMNCPYLDRDSVANLIGACQSYIFSLGTCKAPTTDKINQLSYDSSCRSFLDTLNYAGCYRKNVSRSDFLTKEWKLWFNMPFNFDSNHDQILLLDRNGLLVDRYVY